MNENDITAAPSEKKDGGRLELYDWVQCIVTALLIGILCFMFLFRVIGVIGSSMVPTLKNGDQLIVSRLFYTPDYGDIIVFQTDRFGKDPLVKRVIATGGQTVDIDFVKGIVYVDGVALDEPYTAAPTMTREDFDGEITVPEGYVFVMGDNRNASTDSRSNHVGLVDTRCILGKVYLIIIPGTGEGATSGKRDWSRIGSAY